MVHRHCDIPFGQATLVDRPVARRHPGRLVNHWTMNSHMRTAAAQCTFATLNTSPAFAQQQPAEPCVPATASSQVAAAPHQHASGPAHYFVQSMVTPPCGCCACCPTVQQQRPANSNRLLCLTCIAWSLHCNRMPAAAQQRLAWLSKRTPQSPAVALGTDYPPPPYEHVYRQLADAVPACCTHSAYACADVHKQVSLHACACAGLHCPWDLRRLHPQ